MGQNESSASGGGATVASGNTKGPPLSVATATNPAFHYSTSFEDYSLPAGLEVAAASAGLVVGPRQRSPNSSQKQQQQQKRQIAGDNKNGSAAKMGSGNNGNNSNSGRAPSLKEKQLRGYSAVWVFGTISLICFGINLQNMKKKENLIVPICWVKWVSHKFFNNVSKRLGCPISEASWHAEKMRKKLAENLKELMRLRPRAKP